MNACAIGLGILLLFSGCGSEDKMRLMRWQATVLDSSGVVFQRANEECGVACALMILEQHEQHTISYEEVASSLQRTEGGISMRVLRDFFAARQLPSVGLRLRCEDLQLIPPPAILLVENRHYVLYDGFGPVGKYFLRDPKMGRILIEKDGFERIWGGEALVIGRLRKNDDESSPAFPVWR